VTGVRDFTLILGLYCRLTQVTPYLKPVFTLAVPLQWNRASTYHKAEHPVLILEF
jgi:hypothetical protein